MGRALQVYGSALWAVIAAGLMLLILVDWMLG